jgi:DNA-binding transcriptional ArsR family regulator
MHRERTPTDPGAVREDGLAALAALGNEHRIRILRALAAADEPLSFSELRQRVGIDDTGRFNYHLNELCGRFVRDGKAGYELGYTGERVVLAATDLDPEAATTAEDSNGGNCPVCGDSDCERLIHVHLDGR